MAEILTELEVPEAVKRELILGFKAKMTMAAIEQENVGRATATLGPAKPVEGLGQPKARIPSTIFFRMRQKFGANCWSDPGFLDSYLQKNPGARVPVKLPRTTILRP